MDNLNTERQRKQNNVDQELLGEYPSEGPKIAGRQEERKEVDFDIVSDNWTRIRLDDRTILRVRIDVGKIAFHGIGNLGFPIVEVAASNEVTAFVNDDSLKGPHAQEKVDLRPEDIQSGKEMKLEQMDSNWQEYRILDSPWKLLVRPIVTKVIRTQKYNQFGEPIYWANIQYITDIRKV